MKLEELTRLLSETDPAAVLVDPPVLSRVVQNVTGMTWALFEVPHSHCYVVDRQKLFKYVERDELYLPVDHSIPDPVLLLKRPTTEELNGLRSDLLAHYWRLLFHASIHRELNSKLSHFTAADLRSRKESIGLVASEEARNVLLQDELLNESADDLKAYGEFVATFLELRYFNPALIQVCFPSLPSIKEVEDVIFQDVDGLDLYLRTRLPGTLEPAPKTDDQSDESDDFYNRLNRAAKRSMKVGDTVAAAIHYTRAARVAPAAMTQPTQEEARKNIYHLVERLQKALGLSKQDAENWCSVLPVLLDKADQGSRPVEAALLFDLQRACLDYEETIYTLDAIEWLLSAGHKPIRRELKSQRFVRVPAQLRSAIRRLAAARLSDADRQMLSGLLRTALDRAETNLRGQFRPLLTDALHDAGLKPQSLAEETALAKTVEELLDRISSSGFLSFADVRDGIARGHMKLPDLSGPNEYINGDPLLRLDRRLATELDGVYQRAESYSRWLERVTAFNFGTSTGRWLTWNLTFPFGIAFLVAEFIWLLVYKEFRTPTEAAKTITESHSTIPALLTDETNSAIPATLEIASRTVDAAQSSSIGYFVFGGWNVEIWFHASWVGFGLFLLLVIRSAIVRGALTTVTRQSYRLARLIIWDGPVRLWSNPWVRAIVASVPVQLGLNYLVKPLAFSAIIFLLVPPLWNAGWPARVVTTIAAGFVINSQLGRAVEVVLFEIARRFLDLLHSMPAVLRWINDFFRDLVYILQWILAREKIGCGSGGEVVRSP